MPLSTILEPRFAAAIRHLPWIDGVGAFLVCEGDRVTIGGRSAYNGRSNAARPQPDRHPVPTCAFAWGS